jgi:membrane-bound lytic murein transglycosylase D
MVTSAIMGFLAFAAGPTLMAQASEPEASEMPPSSFGRWKAPPGQPSTLQVQASAAVASVEDLALAAARLDGAASAAAPATEAGGKAAAALPVPAAQAGVEYGIPMPWGEPSFEAFRAAYLSPDGRKWLAAIMERAAPYMAYIAERIRWYNLPDELAFLPVIESEYSPKAVSKSGAMGLWQFMKNSIGGYGIRIDDWVDERRDFMKSTDAALRKLADNYSRYEDWNLALAAYNMGDGAVSRAVRKAAAAQAAEAGRAAPAAATLAEAGTEGGPTGAEAENAAPVPSPPPAAAKIDYWYLRSKGYLSAETTSYVPKFLAVASILLYPRRNGMEAGWAEPADWKAVEIAKPVDLCLLADAAGLPLATLKSGNAELRYTVTPPWKGYRVKVPAAAEEAVKAALADPSLKLIRYYLHTVRSGDTLSAIARHYGTPLQMIVEANPGMRADLLRLGQVIVVPALKEASPMPVAAAADSVLDFSGSYTVAKGDTLWSISLRYEVQPEVLAEKNGLSLSSVIREGMALRVPILK